MKFKHLNVPSHWQNYWTRYPEGHTILEALISWVSQVDSMVDHQNNLNNNVEQFRNEIDTFVERFDERLQNEVIETLSDWQTSGFLEVVISEALQWQLTDYIATNEADKTSLNTQLQQSADGVSVLAFGAKGDGVTDDTQAFIDALQSGSNYVYAPSKNNEMYIITGEIDIPNNVFLDFKNSRVKFSTGDACFNMGLNTRVENISFLDVPPTFELKKAVFYFDGAKIFTVGERKQAQVANVVVNRDVGLYAYQGSVFLLEAKQINSNTSSIISGIHVENIVITRFMRGVHNKVTGLENSLVNSYINSNTFENIKSFNTSELLYDDVIIGNKTQINGNSYRKITGQPTDGLPMVFLHLRGNQNEVTEVSFWDNARNSNTIQIILDGDYNKISGQNMPPFNSQYVLNNGRYNTIVGGTYGTPSYMTSSFVASRSMTTLFNEKYGTMPFEIDSSVADVVAPVTESFSETTPYQSLVLDFSEMRAGNYKFVFNSHGVATSNTRKNTFGVKINGSFLLGGSLENQTGVAWQTETTLHVRKYSAGSILIRGVMQLSSHSQSGSYLWVGEKSIPDINAIVTIDTVFGSSIPNAVTKKASDITVSVPY